MSLVILKIEMDKDEYNYLYHLPIIVSIFQSPSRLFSSTIAAHSEISIRPGMHPRPDFPLP
ncbi:MAG: hypothetical protein WCG14_08225, partial [Chlamydiia bacterium]